MTDRPSPGPGWYPQPDGRLRYWDGRQWTQHVAAPAAPAPGPQRAMSGGALKWVLLAVGVILVVGGGSCIALLASGGGGEACDPQAVAAFESLPPYPGVPVQLGGSPGIGCTDTVQPPDPDAFIGHYERAMQDAGWSVASEEGGLGRGVWGTGPSGGVRLDRLEGNDVGIYVLSPSEFSP